MNRIIKFRVWDKTQNKFLKDGDLGIHNYYLTFDGKVCVSIPDLHGGEIMGRVCEPVIQQFTGLKDKNGREIYEGDIIKVVLGEIPDKGRPLREKIEFITKIEFSDGIFMAKWKNHRMGLYFYTSENAAKIIGNIFENPDLLNK